MVGGLSLADVKEHYHDSYAHDVLEAVRELEGLLQGGADAVHH